MLLALLLHLWQLALDGVDVGQFLNWMRNVLSQLGCFVCWGDWFVLEEVVCEKAVFIFGNLFLWAICFHVVVKTIFLLWAQDVFFVEWSFGDLLILISDRVLAILIGIYYIVHVFFNLSSLLLILFSRFFLANIQWLMMLFMVCLHRFLDLRFFALDAIVKVFIVNWMLLFSLIDVIL